MRTVISVASQIAALEALNANSKTKCAVIIVPSGFSLFLVVHRQHGPNGGDLGGADTLQLAQSLLLANRTPEEAQYLRASVGDALAGALLAVAQQRPQDPVAFIASWLKQRQGKDRIDQPSDKAPSLPVALQQEQHSKNRDENTASRANTVSSSATR